MIFMRLHHVAYGEKAYFVVRLWGLWLLCVFYSFYFLFTTYEVRHSWKDEFRILFDSRMKEYSASDSKKCRYYRNGIMYEFGYSLLT